MISLNVGIALCCILVMTSAWAEKDNDCGRGLQGNTIEINCQLGVIAHDSETRLLRAKNRVSQTLSPAKRKSVESLYMNFTAYKAALCGYIYDDNISGSIRNAMYLQCEDRLNRDFAHYFEAVLKKPGTAHTPGGIW